MNAKIIIFILFGTNIILLILLMISFNQTQKAISNTDTAISIIHTYQNLTDECLRGWNETINFYNSDYQGSDLITMEEIGLK